MTTLAGAAGVAFLVACLVELLRERISVLFRVQGRTFLLFLVMLFSATFFLVISASQAHVKQIGIFTATMAFSIWRLRALRSESSTNTPLDGSYDQKTSVTNRLAEIFLIQAPFIVLATDKRSEVVMSYWEWSGFALFLGFLLWRTLSSFGRTFSHWLAPMWLLATVISIVDTTLGCLTFFSPLICARWLLQDRLDRERFDSKAVALHE